VTVRVADERRFGVRILGVEDARRLGRVAALLYLVCGASIVQLWSTAGDGVAYPTAYLASGIMVLALGLAVLAIARFLPDATVVALAPYEVIGLTFGGAILIPLILYLCGFTAFAIGSSIYALPLIFGFWLLSRRLAFALLGLIALGHALLIWASDGVVAPVGQWLFLLAVLAVAGVLLGGLVDESDRVARSELEARHALADINRDLEVRVAEQVDELERVSRLRRFLSPQVADAVVSSGSESFLEPHRREIAVFFCDLRGFTAFAGRVEPEEVLAVLNDYYEAIGTQLQKFEATVGSFAGDGIMAYLNDPNPCERPATRVIEMALGLKDPMDDLCEEWERHGYELGYGIGIAFGHATLGIIGFDGRNDYTPLGTVVNLAARLCDEASNRQCLIDRHTNAAVGDAFETQRFADLALKGFSSPVATYEVLGLR
jgi:class 3 adenylate cyclase